MQALLCMQKGPPSFWKDDPFMIHENLERKKT